MRLSQLQRAEETQDVTLDFDKAGTIEMVVYPNKRTIGHQRKIKAALDNNDVAGVADLFFSTIKSWDLKGEDDKVLPFTPESIDELGLSTFRRIGEKLGDALNPPEETSN